MTSVHHQICLRFEVMNDKLLILLRRINTIVAVRELLLLKHNIETHCLIGNFMQSFTCIVDYLCKLFYLCHMFALAHFISTWLLIVKMLDSIPSRFYDIVY